MIVPMRLTHALQAYGPHVSDYVAAKRALLKIKPQFVPADVND
jgi:hypothetical protein